MQRLRTGASVGPRAGAARRAERRVDARERNEIADDGDDLGDVRRE
jgi:hypothetical protein